jgi:hypothetical protein
MKIANTEIAEAAYCSEGAVRAARSGGRLNVDSLESIIAWVLMKRLCVGELGVIPGADKPLDDGRKVEPCDDWGA